MVQPPRTPRYITLFVYIELNIETKTEEDVEIKQ